MASRTILALLLLLLAAPAARAQTQLLLDGTLPHGRTDDITATQPGPAYEISEDYGWRSGANLFHSFTLFDIGPGDSATFTADPLEPALSNVIARVTGGEASDIDGTLASTVPGADLYLLNPAGVLFGGASQIDVQRSLYVSTAHRLDFAGGGGSLDLLDPSDPNLSVQPPAAFGFYAGGPREEIIFFNPGGPVTAKNFQVPDGQTLSAVAGDVEVGNRTRLYAFGGHVQLVATGGTDATVPLDASAFDARGVAGLGEVRIEARSNLDTVPFDTNVNQGTVVLRGGSLVLNDRSLVKAGDRNAGNGAAIDVEFADSVDISGRAELRAVSQGPRPSGGVRVSTDSLVVSTDALIRSRQFSYAPAGAVAGGIAIDAAQVRVESGGRVISVNEGPGSGGDISIVADRIDLEEAEISASTTGAGTGGGVTLGGGASAADRITAVDSVIAADGSTLADAGAVSLSADEIELRGVRTQVRATRPLGTAPGAPPTPGSGVALTADGGSVRVLDGATVLTQTSGPNPGGDIRIDAETFEILDGGIDAFDEPRASAVETATLAAGAGGDIHVDVGTLRIGRSEGSELAGRLATAVAAGAAGPGGAIDVIADSVVLDRGGQISTTTLGDGPAGRIDLTVTGGDVLIRGDNVVDDEPQPSGVFARSETDADGNDIAITARSIEVTGGGEISARALGAGRSGHVVLIADELVRVAGAGEQGSVVTARGTDGQGGDVSIEADRLEVLDGGSVDVSTSGSGPGGLLTVTAGDVVVEGFGPVPEGGGDALAASMAAQADGTGDAVGIVIDASRSVRVGPGGQISALSKGLGGSPGNIEIRGKEIEVDGGLVTAVSGQGGGGGISLAARNWVHFEDGAEVTVSSVSGGNAGSIAIAADEVEVMGSAIRADADAFGGNVEIHGNDLVHLLDSEVVALSRGGAGEGQPAGGNVLIDDGLVVLNRSQVVADGFGNANGGNITIAANPYLESTDSQLSASSELGVAGTIVVTAPIAEVVGELSQLPANFLDASSQLEEACIARNAPAGSFKVQRSRVRPPPDALFTPSDAVAPSCGEP